MLKTNQIQYIGGGNIPFKHFISLGYFCSVAKELERIGLRNESGPFDWQSNVNFEERVKLIDCGFDKFISGLNEDNLVQEVRSPQIYVHQSVGTHLVHDFSRYIPLAEQLPSVISKYKRRERYFFCEYKRAYIVFALYL